MNALSRLIANRIAPEAVKPFWSEVMAFAGALALVLFGLRLLHAAPLDPAMQTAFLLFPILAVPVLTLARGVLRGVARRLLGLPKDVLPVGAKLFPAFSDPSVYEQVDWHLSQDGTRRILLAHNTASWLSLLALFIIPHLLDPDVISQLAILLHLPFGIGGLLLALGGLLAFAMIAAAVRNTATLIRPQQSDVSGMVDQPQD